MKKKLFLALGLGALITVSAQQTQQVEQLDSVYIDTKIPLARKNSGKVVVQISSETLAQNAGRSAADVINEVSGIEINGNGSNAGQNLGYFVRGGRNRQVLILVDGVPLNDPSQIANDYDLRLVAANSLESIEISKGASSVLYGSGAATAVISLKTKQESSKPFAGNLSTVVGSNAAAEDEKLRAEEMVNNARLSGTLHKFFYNASFSNRYTKGLSAVAAPKDSVAFHPDVYNSFNTRLNVGVHISEKIKLSRFFSFDKFKADFDSFSFVDADHQSISQQVRTGGNFQWNFAKGSVTVNDSYSWIEREIASSFPANYDSKSYSVDSYLTYSLPKGITAMVGLSANISSFNSFSIPFGATDFAQDVSDEVAKFDIVDPYVNIVYNSDFGLNVNAGARLNNHSNYGTHVVYNVNPSYSVNFGKFNLKGLGSYSTAYITPSLFQLYDPLYGNQELVPEENTTLEGGLEFSKGANLRISALYFSREETNFVDFITVDPELFIFQYQNISEEFSTSGIEVEAYAKLGAKVSFTANYTNTKADERFALRIPEHKAFAGLNYMPDVKTNVGLSYQYVSERDDSFFNPETFASEPIVLESYGLLNFNVSRQFTENIKLFLGLSNVLDEQYEELYRFQTRGRNVRLGLNLSF